MQRLVFGEYDGRLSARAETLLDFCLRGGINAELSDDVRKAIWEKFVFLVGLSGSTTTMRETIGPIRSNPRSRRFLGELMGGTLPGGPPPGGPPPPGLWGPRPGFRHGAPARVTS